MQPYSHLDLIQEKYPHPGCLKVYQALRLLINRRSQEVNWGDFTLQDWDLLEKMAVREQVDGLAYQALRHEQRPPNAPKLMIARMGAAFHRNQSQYDRYRTELQDHLAPALAAAGQKLILLKGVALASTLYDMPGQRPMVDIDCLVDRSSLPGVMETIKNIGYAQEMDGLLVPGVAYFEYHMVMLREDSPGLMLELHHTLLGAGQEYFQLDMDWFLTQTLRMPADWPDVLLTFTPAAHLLHLAIHLLLQHGEGESDLLHFFDLHLLLERWGGQIDWSLLLEKTRAMNLDYAVFAALQGCQARFDTPVPPVFARAPIGRRVQPIQDFIDTRRRPIPLTHTERYLKKLANRPLPTQVALALRFAFPLPEFMRRRYNIHPSWLWPLSYPLRWAIGIGHLFDMVRRKK